MADTALTDMKGRFAELLNDGADFQVIPLSAKDTDGVFEDGYASASITNILGGGAVEQTGSTWVRKTHTNGNITSSADDTANLWRVVLDADDTWSAVLASNDVVALLIAEVGSGDGTDRVIGQWDFAVTTDGNDVTANYDQTNGIWTAA